MHIAQQERAISAQVTPETPQLINEREVCDILGCSASHLSTLVRRGEFPAPIRLGPKFKRWSLGEVIGFVFEKSAAAKKASA